MHKAYDVYACVMVGHNFGLIVICLSTPTIGSRKSWQVITAVHDEVDGLALCEQSHEVMTTLILVVLPWKVLLWSCL
jgi:hypothetical protein